MGDYLDAKQVERLRRSAGDDHIVRLCDTSEHLRSGLRHARDEIEVLRGIVQRVNDGWVYRRGDWLIPEERGAWLRSDGEDQVMTEAEQRVLYGSVVREEETS